MRTWGVALVHYPVLDREGDVVTTSITNLDIHDIARSSYTYGAARYVLVHPITAQRELVEEIRVHWTEGSGGRRIPDRKPPMQSVATSTSLEDARLSMGPETELWVTSARPLPRALDHGTARRVLLGEGPPVLLVFGTGYGLAPEVTDKADVALAPIESPRPDGYNHLSVRAAVAILLDRLTLPSGFPSSAVASIGDPTARGED